MLDNLKQLLYYCVSQVIQLEKNMYSFSNDTPIYLQIMEHLKTEIITGKYVPGEKLMSVREFSLYFQVNPNTIQKALFELESMGLITTERTNGKFVSNDKELIQKVKNETVKKMVEDFYISFAKIGVSKEQLIEILKKEE